MALSDDQPAACHPARVIAMLPQIRGTLKSLCVGGKPDAAGHGIPAPTPQGRNQKGRRPCKPEGMQRQTNAFARARTLPPQGSTTPTPSNYSTRDPDAAGWETQTPTSQANTDSSHICASGVSLQTEQAVFPPGLYTSRAVDQQCKVSWAWVRLGL